MPLFGNLEGHGVTTYGTVPSDRSIEVDDESTAAWRERRRSGVRVVTEGSTNGHYLQDRIEFQFLAKAVAKEDYKQRADHRLILDKLNAIRDTRNSWPWTVAGLRMAVGNPSQWMNETWGPPIKNACGKFLEPAKPEDETDHPSQTRRLSAQYGGNRKRHSEIQLRGRRPTKQLKKKHKRYTWPASPEINCVRPDLQDRMKAINQVLSKHQASKLIMQSPNLEEPSDSICSRCGKECNREQMFSCPLCTRLAYCSLVCQKMRLAASCSQSCKNETSAKSDTQELLSVLHPASYDSSASSSETAVGEGEHSTSSSSSDGSSDESAFQSSSLGLSASEIEEQVKAMEGLERVKLQRELKEQIDDLQIDDHRILHKGRTLQYEIVNMKNYRRRWCDATDLHGSEWTQEMSDYWYNSRRNSVTRRFLEDPDGDKGFEPAPFGRFILKAEFSQEREIVFDLRDFERATPEGVEDGRYWSTSHELGEEWDDAIEKYWTRCKIAQDWHERKKVIDNMFLVATEQRKDSIIEVNMTSGGDQTSSSFCDVPR